MLVSWSYKILFSETEQRRAHKKSTWDSIKRVCKIYKQYLDFHIHIFREEEKEQLKVSFFVNDFNAENEYFVRLLNCNNQWKGMQHPFFYNYLPLYDTNLWIYFLVEQIQPSLKEKHLADFERIIDFSKQSMVLDMTAFLCKLRNIFTKYYLNVE